MTKAEILRAAADEKEFEMRGAHGWEHVTHSNLLRMIANYSKTFDHTDIRLKPTKRTVPLEPEDVPPGSAVRSIGDKDWRIVTQVYSGGLYGGSYGYSWEHAAATLEISRDGGKTWRRGEKEVVE